MTFSKKRIFSRLLIEWWIVLSLLLLLILGVLNRPSITLANDYIYDRLLAAHERVANDQIVLITIDEASIGALGRWPWPRTTHAELFDVLAQQQPKAVLFDVLLTEPTTDDARLGASIAKLPFLAAPVLMDLDGSGQWRTTLPVESVQRVSQLGHIALSPDADGVVRTVPLSRKDDQGREWPLLTTLLVGADRRTDESSMLRVPFNVPQGSYIEFSYQDVLQGQVPEGFLKNKYILIGATATALGDRYPTPSSGHWGVMPGVEIQANILDALLGNLSVKTWTSALVPIAPVVVLLLLLLFIHERYHLWVFVAVSAAYLALVCFMLWQYLIWLPPVLGLSGLLAAYVLWSWRRLSVMLRYVGSELNDLRQQTGQVFQYLPEVQGWHLLRPRTLEVDIAHAQYLSHFVTNSLQQLPIAMCLLDSAGRILMQNHAAKQLFGSVLNQDFAQVMMKFDEQASAWLPSLASDWQALQDKEVSDAQGRAFELHVIPIEITDSALFEKEHRLWQISFVDLSNERTAQRQRNELMTFLSHDLRTPQVDILALMDLYRAQYTITNNDELMQEISVRVHRTLDWANDLVELSRAQSREFYQMLEVNLFELAFTAVQQVLPSAMEKQIEIVLDEAVHDEFEQAYVMADGNMLVRALVNLLTNALRYSHPHSTIRISAVFTDTTVTCCIQDEGVGMSLEQVNQLNQGISMRRSSSNKKPDAAQSLNVGLHMVMSVIRQHHGQLHFESQLGLGTTVQVSLPKFSNGLENHASLDVF